MYAWDKFDYRSVSFSNQFQAILHGPAVKKDSSYLYQMSHTAILGPYHPNHSKSALVCVTTSGLLKVLWMQSNGKWCESHTELESVVSSDDLVTHAAICPDRGKW